MTSGGQCEESGAELDARLREYRRGTTRQPAFRARQAGGYAAATASALSLAGGAEAATIYSGLQNIVLEPYRFSASTFVGLELDLDGAFGNDLGLGIYIASSFSFSAGYGSGIYARFRGAARVDQRFGLPNGAGILQGTATGARRLSSGETISSGAGDFVLGAPPMNRYNLIRSTSGTVMNTFSSVAGTWAGSTTGFLGIALQRGGDTHYGWVRLQLEDRGGSPSQAPDGASDKLTVVDWAWNSVPGAPIVAGVLVPEPSTLQLLAVGALGTQAFRKRRREREGREGARRDEATGAA